MAFPDDKGAVGEWLPVTQAAKLAPIPRRTAYRWIGKGLVPSRMDQGQLLVTAESLRALARSPRRAMVALGGTGEPGEPPFRRYGFQFDPDETAESATEALEILQDEVAALAKRVEAVEVRGSAGTRGDPRGPRSSGTA